MLVEQRVTRIVAERLGCHVLVEQGGQDADHHHMGAGLAGPVLGGVERVPHLALVAIDAVSRQALGRDIDLEVEAAEFLYEGRVIDMGEHLCIAQRRAAVLIHQVELHLHAGLRPVEVEP